MCPGTHDTSIVAHGELGQGSKLGNPSLIQQLGKLEAALRMIERVPSTELAYSEASMWRLQVRAQGWLVQCERDVLLDTCSILTSCNLYDHPAVRYHCDGDVLVSRIQTMME